MRYTFAESIHLALSGKVLSYLRLDSFACQSCLSLQLFCFVFLPQGFFVRRYIFYNALRIRSNNVLSTAPTIAALAFSQIIKRDSPRTKKRSWKTLCVEWSNERDGVKFQKTIYELSPEEQEELCGLDFRYLELIVWITFFIRSATSRIYKPRFTLGIATMHERIREAWISLFFIPKTRSNSW